MKPDDGALKRDDSKVEHTAHRKTPHVYANMTGGAADAGQLSLSYYLSFPSGPLTVPPLLILLLSG